MTPDSPVPEKDEFKIGEVCEIAGVKPFVLRYWETEFPDLSPAKGSGGQRTYTREDVDLVLRIKKLLYEERFTVAGAKKRLSEESQRPAPRPSSRPAQPAETAKLRTLLMGVRQEIAAILETLKD